MKKIKNQIFLLTSLLFSLATKAQIGINALTASATLHVGAKSTDGTTAEGILCPRLTGDQIKAGDAQYTAVQTGIIVYATAAVNTATPKTGNISTPGYYYFDGNVWQKLMTVSSTSKIFIPYIVAAGSTTATQTVSGIQNFTKALFNNSINDGNWSTANNNYKATKAGFYQVSFQSEEYPSTAPNSFVWAARVTSGANVQSIILASTINTSTGPNNTLNKGGSITVNLNANDVLDFGFTTVGTFTMNKKSFTITFLGP